MRKKSIGVGLVVTLVCILSAIAADNRFDGIWVGTESVMAEETHGLLKSEAYAQKQPARIAIAQGGTLVGVIEGRGVGRYNNVEHAGNALVFRSSNRVGQLTLSADGQTMTEKGVAPAMKITNYGSREGALNGHSPVRAAGGWTEVTGTFHRQK
jgi:hypothetical protein